MGTKNDEYNNHKITEIGNTQENTEKHESQGKATHFIEVDKLLFTYKRKKNLLKQWRLPSITVGSVGAEMYFVALCICSKTLTFHKRDS